MTPARDQFDLFAAAPAPAAPPPLPPALPVPADPAGFAFPAAAPGPDPVAALADLVIVAELPHGRVAVARAGWDRMRHWDAHLRPQWLAIPWAARPLDGVLCQVLEHTWKLRVFCEGYTPEGHAKLQPVFVQEAHAEARRLRNSPTPTEDVFHVA